MAASDGGSSRFDAPGLSAISAVGPSAAGPRERGMPLRYPAPKRLEAAMWGLDGYAAAAGRQWDRIPPFRFSPTPSRWFRHRAKTKVSPEEPAPVPRVADLPAWDLACTRGSVRDSAFPCRHVSDRPLAARASPHPSYTDSRVGLPRRLSRPAARGDFGSQAPAQEPGAKPGTADRYRARGKPTRLSRRTAVLPKTRGKPTRLSRRTAVASTGASPRGYQGELQEVPTRGKPTRLSRRTAVASAAASPRGYRSGRDETLRL